MAGLDRPSTSFRAMKKDVDVGRARPGMTENAEGARTMNHMNVDYSTKIPNNVNLSEDRQVLKALEGWHPGYMDWWSDMGPEGFQQSLVYLRTAYSVDPR